MPPGIEICDGPVGHEPFEGRVYRCAGPGVHPGILVLHGSDGGWGGWSSEVALWFATCGFTTFAFTYSKSGNPWSSGDIEDVPLEKTAEALQAFRAQFCPGRKVGLYGASRGAEHALLLTSLLAAEGDKERLPSAVAVHAPADVVCGAWRSAWAREGTEARGWDGAARAWTWKGSHARVELGTPIRIDAYEGPLYVSHGTDDLTWSCDMTRRLERRLLDAGRTPEVHYYPGQAHRLDAGTQNVNRARLVDFFGRWLRDE